MSAGDGVQAVLIEFGSSDWFRPLSRQQCTRYCPDGMLPQRQPVDKRRWHEGRGRESPRRSEFPTSRALGRWMGAREWPSARKILPNGV